MFTKVNERIPIKDIIVSQIEKAILEKKYVPGSKLPSENELCQQFNVSRTSVREALQILAARGLITIEKGKGIFVSKLTSESVSDPLKKLLMLRLDRNAVLDLTHARQILEPAIAREAAKNRTDDDIEQLENDIVQLSECSGDFDKLSELDMRFHFDLAKATHNLIVPLLIKPIHNLLPKVKPFVYAKVEDAKEAALIWHRKILDAIINQDEEGAYREMLEHLKIAEEHAKKLLEFQNDKNKE